MSLSSQKASVLVTGASSGIGAQIAREFSENGYFVYLLGRSEDKLKSVQISCPGQSQILAFDLKVLSKFEENLKTVFQKNPPLEILVNNAGVYNSTSFEKTTDEIWTEQFEVNLLAPVRLTRLVWPLFVQQSKGSIVNISSTLGLKPTPNTSAYSAIKAAMNNWTLNLAQEGGKFNIRANAVCPGIIDTPIHSFHTLPEKEKADVAENISHIQLLKPLGSTADVAKAVFFLGSDDSKWTTGTLLSVDGGVNIK